MPTRINEAAWIESRQRWQINIQDDGERRTFTSSIPGRKGKIAAEKRADQWLESKKVRTNIRFKTAWEQFLSYIKLNNSAGDWHQLDSIGRNWFLPTLSNKKVANISSGNWDGCVQTAFVAGRSKHTLENIRNAATRFYGYAKKHRWQMEKPEDITISKKAPVKEKTILQPEDIQILTTQDTVKLYGKPRPCFFIHAWRFLVYTGLRRGELAGIQDGDITEVILPINQEEIKYTVLSINRAIDSYGNINDHGKSDAAIRQFVLCDQAVDELKAQKKMLKRLGIISPWIFPDEYGQMLDTDHLYSKWMTYRRQHGIKSSLHEMRHTFISVNKNDVPAQMLKKAVGHTPSMDTFGQYGHEVNGEMLEMAAIVTGVFNKILKK